MSHLRIFADNDPAEPLFESADRQHVAGALNAAGVRFEQWEAEQPVRAGDSSEQVMRAYRSAIDRLLDEEGYQTVDVISLDAADEKTRASVPELRGKFLSEHRHQEDEVRFFVEGRGLFSLHLGDRVYEVLCEKGDLISVPANTPHWFDMGPEPAFVALRFFNNPEGWVAHYTGDAIADRFSRLEA